MPTRKIAEAYIWKKQICHDREHNPPNMMVFSPGTYEHECPSCHVKQVFTIPSQCMARESGGVQCEFASGHEGGHGCSESIKGFLTKYQNSSLYGVFREKK